MTAPVDPPPGQPAPLVPQDDRLVRSAERRDVPVDGDVPRQASMSRLWFAFVGGVSAYVVHLAAIYWPLETCTPVDQPVAAIATALALAVAAAATITGVRALAALPARPRQRERLPRPTQPLADGWDPVPDASVRRWLAVGGIVLSGLASLILLIVGVAVMVVPPCV